MLSPLVGTLKTADVISKENAQTLYGQEECLTELVNEDSSFYKQADVSGKTAMIKCAEMGYKQCLKILISAYDKLSGKTSTGKEKLKYIDIQRGLNMCDATGATALMYAIQNKHLDCVKLLIHSGADVNKKDTDSGTALMKAAKVGCHEIIDELIKAGAEINIRDNKGNTALMWSVIEKHPECLTRLTECPDFVADQENIDGMTPVMWAAQNGDTQCLHILLQFQVDVQKKDRKGKTALFKAAIKGGTKVLKVLLRINESSQINGRDTSTNHAECVRMILDYMERQRYSQRGLQEDQLRAQVAAATGEKYAEFKEMFWGKYSKIHRFESELCERNRVYALGKEFKEFAFLKCSLLTMIHVALGEKSWSLADTNYVVMAAAGYSGNLECLQTFLGGSVSSVDATYMKNIFLVWAVTGGCTQAVRFLFQRMQGITIFQANGCEEWHKRIRYILSDNDKLLWQTGPAIAIMSGNAEILQVFIDHIPDITYCSGCGTFPLLLLAAQMGKTECLKCLTDNIADVNVRDSEGNTALVAAILLSSGLLMAEKKSTCFDCVTYLIDKGADLNIQNSDGNTALILAVQKEQHVYVKLLTEKGADLNRKNRAGNTALMLAVDNKTGFDCVKLLIDKGADINVNSKIGNTPLMLAVKKKRYDYVKFLIDKGADLDKKNCKGYTALTLSVNKAWFDGFEILLKTRHNVDMVRQNEHTTHSRDLHCQSSMTLSRQQLNLIHIFIDTGVNVNICLDTKGNTILILAARWYGKEAVKLLVESGADVNQQNNNRDTALRFARDVKTVEYLVGVGADLNQQNNNGDTALMLAHDVKTVQYLVGVGADRKCVNKQKDTALTLAIRHRSQDRRRVYALLGVKATNSCIDLTVQDEFNHKTTKHGSETEAIVNHINREGDTVLMLAFRFREKPEVIKLMVKSGANVNYINDKDGETALTLAIRVTHNSKTLKHLVEAGTKVSYNIDNDGQPALTLANIRERGRECDPYVAILLEAGANANYVNDKNGESPLTLAAAECSLRCLETLLNHEAIINYRRRDGKTALLVCLSSSVNGYFDPSAKVKVFIGCGADINIRDSEGRTALMYAAVGGFIESMQMLLDAKADVHFKDSDNETALILAVKHKNAECMQALVNAGADLDFLDANSKSALMFSAERGRVDCTQVLPNAGADVTMLVPKVGHGECFKLPCMVNDVETVSFYEGHDILSDTAGNHHDTKPVDTRCDAGAISTHSTQNITRMITMRCDTSIQKRCNKRKVFSCSSVKWRKYTCKYRETTNNPCAICFLREFSRYHGYSHITKILSRHCCRKDVIDPDKGPYDVRHINDTMEFIKSAFGDYVNCLHSFICVTTELSKGACGEIPRVVKFTTCGSKICKQLFYCLSSGNISPKYDNILHDICYIWYDRHECVQLSASTVTTTDDTDKYHKCGLLHAAGHGHDKCVQQLIKAGCSFEKTHGFGKHTALMYAAEKGHTKCVQILIDAGCRVDQTDEYSGTAVMYASRNGHEKCVQLLIKTGCRLNKIDDSKETALMKAASRGHDKCLQLLIEAGCLLDKADGISEKTALIYAAKNGHEKCVELLIEAGFLLDETDGIHEKTALMYAAENGHEKCVQLLIHAKCQLDQKSANAKTALGYAVDNSHCTCAELLVQAGSDISFVCDRDNRIPLMKATEKCNKIMAQFLIDHGTCIRPLWDILYASYNEYKLASTCVRLILNPPKCPEIDETFSHSAVECIKQLLKENLQLCDFLVAPEARQGHVECLGVLQKAGITITMSECLSDFDKRRLVDSDLTTINSLVTVGADVNETNKDGISLLMTVSRRNFVFAVKSLVVFNDKIELNKQDSKGFTALTWAVCENAVQCIEILLGSGAHVGKVTTDGHTCLMIAALNGHDECLSLLLQYIRQLDHVYRDGTAMTTAIGGKKKCVKVLAEHGADNDKRNFSGETALMLAAREGHVMCVQHLIGSGCDINLRSTEGFTSVIMAARMGHKKCLQKLITACADLDKVDKEGMTALMHAAREGKKECLNLLIIAEASLDLTDNFKDYTALMFAAETGQLECLQLLSSSNANVNFQNKSGKTAVMVAVEAQQGSCLYHLLTAGAVITLVDKNKKTAFETAIESDNLELVHIFVFGSADVNFVNKDGLSPLMIALKSGKLRIARYLMALTFMNIQDLHYRFIFGTPTNMSKEALCFQQNLCSQPWPLAKLCFIRVSTCFVKNPTRRLIIESETWIPMKSLLNFQLQSISLILLNKWGPSLLSISSDEYMNLLQDTKCELYETRIPNARGWHVSEETKARIENMDSGGVEEVVDCSSQTDDGNTNMANNKTSPETARRNSNMGVGDADPGTNDEENMDMAVTDGTDDVTVIPHLTPSFDITESINSDIITPELSPKDTVPAHKDTENTGSIQLTDRPLNANNKASILNLILSLHNLATHAPKSTPFTKTGQLTGLEETFLQMWPVARDGDCLIRATLRQDSTFRFVKELRDAICNHLMLHRHHYMQFLSVNDMNQFQSKVELLRQLGHWNSDIGDLVPLAISNLLKRKIIIYSNKENFRDILITPYLYQVSGDNLVYVYHDSPGHYNNVMSLGAPV